MFECERRCGETRGSSNKRKAASDAPASTNRVPTRNEVLNAIAILIALSILAGHFTKVIDH